MPVIDTFCCSCTFFAKNNNKSEKFFLLIYVYLLYKGENVIKLIGRPSIFVTPAPNTTKSNGRQQQQGAVNIQCAGKKDGNKTRDRKSNQNRIPNLEYDRLKKFSIRTHCRCCCPLLFFFISSSFFLFFASRCGGTLGVKCRRSGLKIS